MARPKLYDDDLRDRLLDEAVAIVAGGGLGALSVRGVAAAAGTSTSAVYSLFGSKEYLAREVLIRAFRSFAAAQQSAVTGDLADDVAGLGVMYIQWALDNPRLFELMFGPQVAGISTSADLDAAASQAMTPLATGVAQAIEAGIFREADPTTIVASLWAQVHGLTLLLLADRLPPGADPARAAMAVLDGWKASGPGSDHRGLG